MGDYLTVEEAGREWYGLGRARSYALAARGVLPTVRLGRRLLVPKRGLQALEDAAIRRALEAADESRGPGAA